VPSARDGGMAGGYCVRATALAWPARSARSVSCVRTPDPLTAAAQEGSSRLGTIGLSGKPPSKTETDGG
jgi:hypothetical protein